MLASKKVLAVIAVITIISLIALHPLQHKYSSKHALIPIPSLGLPQEAFREGYIYGYVVGKVISTDDTAGNTLKIKLKITYVGNASAPEELLIKPVMANNLEVSLPPSMAKEVLMKYQSNGKALLNLLFSGVISFDQDVPGRVWINPSKLLNVTSEKPIIVHRNSSTIVTILVKPATLSPIERKIACNLLGERLSRIGIKGSLSIDFKLFNAMTGKPATRVWKKSPFASTKIPELVLLAMPVNIPAAKAYYISCTYNTTNGGGK
jgi:hypothetical protein